MGALGRIIKAIKVIPVFILAFIITVPAFAYRAVGWHWYNELPFVKEKQEKDKKEEKSKGAGFSQNSATAEIDKLNKFVQEAKAQAILYPTEANVRDYIALQNHVAEKAAVFSRVWQKVLLDYPELDYRVSNPTQSSIQSVVYDEKHKREDDAIKFFRERYGLFFFYRGNNPIDQELAKVVETFTKDNQVFLMPISVDGRMLETFAANSIDRGQAKKLGVEYFPALILVDPSSKKIKPLNYGFISGAELRARFLQIATDFHDGV
jgi:conjugal transfer pilus assembly protein TraF